MSRFYLYHSDNQNYESYLIEDESDYDTLSFLEGERLGNRWNGAIIELTEKGGLPSDFPSFMCVNPLLSERAWKTLSPLLSPFVEALPVVSQSHQHFYVLNVLSIYDDIFDTDNSRFSFNKYSKSISSVYEYAFKNTSSIKSPIFKAKETMWIHTYLTDDFIKMVKEAGLIGLNAIPIA